MSKRILIVTAEKNLAHLMAMELQNEGFQLSVAASGQAGLDLAQTTDFDMFLVDIALPEMSGQAFAQALSAFKPAAVILAMTRAEEAQTRAEELASYAAACIVKPFVLPDLIAHIQAIFRGRDFIDQHCRLMRLPAVYQDLHIDAEHHTVQRGETLIPLTRREFELLATLMEAGQVLTREQILARVWKYEASMETNIVDVYIRYLRTKLDLPGRPSYIKTVRGVGYSMRM